ncbi:hypothetical protein [Rhodopila sp.]|uniref:hypothetical protein n=1 Tax=Rhodopila sp. TaxID=2480087 RepID=UPI003D114E6E
MPAGRSGLPGGLFVILVCITPTLIYRAAPGWIISAVVAGQVTAVVWWLAANLAVRYRVMLAALAVGGVTVVALALGLSARSVGLVLGGVCHAVAYACLLTWFATSLRSSHDSVVTGLARLMRRTMPDKVVRYTRFVTFAWCIFFTAQLATSAMLLIATPVSVWSRFVTVWNLPLVVAMGLSEYACRWLLFRREPRTGLVATLIGLRHIGDLSGNGR